MIRLSGDCLTVNKFLANYEFETPSALGGSGNRGENLAVENGQ